MSCGADLAMCDMGASQAHLRNSASEGERAQARSTHCPNANGPSDPGQGASGPDEALWHGPQPRDVPMATRSQPVTSQSEAQGSLEGQATHTASLTMPPNGSCEPEEGSHDEEYIHGAQLTEEDGALPVAGMTKSEYLPGLAEPGQIGASNENGL